MKQDSEKSFWLLRGSLSAVFVLLAAVFAFFMTGYGCMALLCLGIAALIVLFGLLRQHGKRKLRRLLTALLLLGGTIFGCAEIPIVRAASGGSEPADYLIVLGAGVNGVSPSLSMLNRLTAALDYLNANPGCKAIVTGGQGPDEDITEAQAMYTWLLSCGVSPERVLKEEQAENTRENIAYALEIIKKDAGTIPGKVAVCSSEYHLYRAEYLLRQKGVEPVGVPGRTTYPVLRLNYFLREGLAVWYMWCFGG